MSSLRTLLGYISQSDRTLDFNTIHVYDNSETPNNGGSCCLFTIPCNVSWAAIEVWGGGGGGAAACGGGRMAGWPGGSGSYSRKIINGLTQGDCLTICAGGTTGTSSNGCRGCIGNSSYVQLNGTVQACASGGCRGCVKCEFQDNCSCQGCKHCHVTSGFACGTMCLPGMYGGAKGSSFCASQHWQGMPSAPMTGGGVRNSWDGCARGNNHGCCNGPPSWPGGGGASAISTGSSNDGQFGAAGLVIVYYGVKT